MAIGCTDTTGWLLEVQQADQQWHPSIHMADHNTEVGIRLEQAMDLLHSAKSNQRYSRLVYRLRHRRSGEVIPEQMLIS